MDLVKWPNILVEWVNCLKIIAPIQSLSDLKGETFFRNLLSLITGDYTTECITLPDFLKMHYPAYQLSNESPLLADSVELCNTCSLLLHYACVVDGRPHLTAPLCNAMSPQSQVSVRAFLEVLAMAPAVTRQLLNLALLNTQPPSPAEVPEKEPPLQEYLRTPLKKTMEAHKQQVKNLESQLEMERFEKEELQEELTLQQRANDKLEKTIAERQAEIRTLKEQLVAKEIHSGGRKPLSPYRDGRAEARRLRQELESLEKYVDVAHVEQAALQDRVDKAENKARDLEIQLVRWRGEAESTACELVELKGAHAQAGAEMAAMKERSDELSALLAELRPHKTHDESLDSTGATPLHNISGAIDNETLAQTVVDLQLVDALNENRILKNEILELQQQIKYSDTISVEIKSKLSDTEFNLSYFKTENENLTSDLKINQEKLQKINQIFINFSNKHNLDTSDINFCDKFENILLKYEESIKILQENEIQNKEAFKNTQERIKSIQNNLEEYSQEIESYKKLFKDQKIVIDQLNKNVEELRTSKTISEEKITELVQQVLEYKLKLKETNLELSEMNRIVENFNDEKSQSHERINALLKKLAFTERNLEQTLTKVKQLDTLFVEKIQELNTNQKDYTSKCDQNEKLVKENNDLKLFVQKLELEITDQIKTKKKLQEKYKQSKESGEKLSFELQSFANLPSEIENYQKETENLRLNLKEKENQIQQSNLQISILQNNLKTLEDNLNTEKVQRNTLQINNDTFSAKLKENEHKMADVQSQKTKLQTSILTLNKKLEHEINQNRDLEQQNLKLVEENTQIESEMSELKENYCKVNLKLEEVIETVTNEKEKMTLELKTLNVNIETMEKQIESGKETIKCLENEKQNFLKNIENLNRKYAEKKMAAKNCQQQNDELISELQFIHEKLKILESDGENNVETIKVLITNKKELITTNNSLETELKQSKILNTTLETKLQEINNCFEDLQKSKTENEVKIQTLMETEKSLQEKLEICQNEKLNLENKLQVLQIEMKEKEEKLQKELENTAKSLKEKESNLKDLFLQKSELTEQLDNLQQQLDYNNEKLNQQLIDVKESFDVQKAEMVEKTSKFETETTELKDKLQLVETELLKLLKIVEKENLQICFDTPNDLAVKLSNLETIIFALISERRSGKSECGNLKQKIAELEQIILELSQKNNSLQQNLDLNKSNLKNYQKKLTEVNQKLDETVANTETVLKSHQIEIAQLESDLRLKREKLVGNDVFIKLQLEKNNLEALVQEKDEFISELEKKIQEFNLDFDSSQNIPQKLSQINNFCTDSLNKFISIYTIVFETDFPGNTTENFNKLVTEINNFKIKTNQLSDLNLQVAKYQKLLSEKQLECKTHSEELSLLKTTTTNLQKLVQEAEIERREERKREIVEEKTQLKSENDTLKYKRQRDREEFVRRMEEKGKEHDRQMQKVREEYEEKLGKMKHKIVKLYREEVEKEKKKACTFQHGQTEETIASLKSQLWLTGNKYTELKRDYESLKSRMCDLQSVERRAHSQLETAGLGIEDEQGEMWNNTYLADLQAGRCDTDVSSRASSTSSRLSELQFRNSLCPPHLKSSYTVELAGEPLLGEEDVKAGPELDTSLSSRLLPPGAERRRKDRGQTLYKKPGPPTPSKLGGSGQGRGSLQGNEVLREHNKQSTPSRLRALFSRSAKDQENVSTSTPRTKTKRRSIFRM